MSDRSPPWFLSLGSSSPVEREQAWKMLKACLDELAARGLFERRSQEKFFIPADERDDVVSCVLLKLVDKRGFPETVSEEAQAKRYLQTMLVNNHISRHRGPSGREVREVDAPGELAAIVDSRAEIAGHLHVSEGNQLLERIFAAALAARAERHRPALAAAWRQVKAMVFEGMDMDELLSRDEGVTPTTPTVERIKARDRVLTAHSRLRRDLARALESLVERGVLGQEDRDTGRALLGRLVRCQRSSSVASTMAKE